jgi:hypothetical protein
MKGCLPLLIEVANGMVSGLSLLRSDVPGDACTMHDVKFNDTIIKASYLPPIVLLHDLCLTLAPLKEDPVLAPTLTSWYPHTSDVHMAYLAALKGGAFANVVSTTNKALSCLLCPL